MLLSVYTVKMYVHGHAHQILKKGQWIFHWISFPVHVGCSSCTCGQSFDLSWTCQQGQYQTDEETGQERVWHSPRGKLHTTERQQHEKVHLNSKHYVHVHINLISPKYLTFPWLF